MDTQQILVAYATKHGATAEIATAIAQTLKSHGLVVDARPAGDVRDLAPYGMIVLGSAVYMGRWRADARAFARRHRQALRERPVWLFSSGPVDSGTPHPEDVPVPPGVTRLARRIGSRGHVTFGGRLAEDAPGFVEQRLVKAGKAGDSRDFERIRAWGRDLAAEMNRLRAEASA